MSRRSPIDGGGDRETLGAAEIRRPGGARRGHRYDAVVEKLDLGGAAPSGLFVHTAGFDHDAGVFRILDVWETREDGERFMKDHLEPIVEAMAVAAGESGDDFAPPTREGWDELHDSMAG